jgi:hypothetical protein
LSNKGIYGDKEMPDVFKILKDLELKAVGLMKKIRCRKAICPFRLSGC